MINKNNHYACNIKQDKPVSHLDVKQKDSYGSSSV